MNPYYWAALALFVCTALPALWVAAKGTWKDAVITLEAMSTAAPLILLLGAAGASGSQLSSPALAAAALLLGGSLVFIRAIERWG